MSESQFEHGWNVLWWSEMSVSAWLEWIVVRKASFIMSGTGLGPKCRNDGLKCLKRSIKVVKTSYTSHNPSYMLKKN
jgi:hypothetical protein